MRNTALMVVAALSVLSMCASAQTSTAPLLEEVAKALGFTDQEVAQIKPARSSRPT
jgi:hypothetical protein